MDQELKQHLEAMEGRLWEHTEAVETRMRAHTDSVVDAAEIRLREHTETVETRLLGEFWKWARSSDAKARQNGFNISAFDERLSIVEERIATIERHRTGN